MYWTPGVKFGNSVLFLFHKSFRLVNMTSISEHMALNKVAYGHRPIRDFPNEE